MKNKIILFVGVFILSLFFLASFASAFSWSYTRDYGQDYRYRGGYIEPSYYPGFYNSFSYRPSYSRSSPYSFRDGMYNSRSYSYYPYSSHRMFGSHMGGYSRYRW